MFTLDQTTGSITNALKHLMNDPCPGKLEVAIHSNESRSAMWLLVRWGRFNFITLPVANSEENIALAKSMGCDPRDVFKWFECRDGEQTVYSGKPWFCTVTAPVEPERELVRTEITKALTKLIEKLRAYEDRIYAQMQKAAS